MCYHYCKKCYGKIEYDMEKVIVTPCNHVFHLSCLVRAYEIMSYCQYCGNKGTYVYYNPYIVFVQSAIDRIKKIEGTRISSEEERLKILLNVMDDIIDTLNSFKETEGLDVPKLKLLEKINHAVKRRIHMYAPMAKKLEEKIDKISRMGLYDIAEET